RPHTLDPGRQDRARRGAHRPHRRLRRGRAAGRRVRATRHPRPPGASGGRAGAGGGGPAAAARHLARVDAVVPRTRPAPGPRLAGHPAPGRPRGRAHRLLVDARLPGARPRRDHPGGRGCRCGPARPHHSAAAATGGAMSAAEPVLTVEQLTVRIPTRAGTVHAVTEVDLRLDAGRVHALVGESGCGKSVTGAAICGLLPRDASVRGRALLHDGGTAPVDLVTAGPATWRRLRGRRIASIPQSAATSISPLRTLGAQLAETCAHLDADGTRIAWIPQSAATSFTPVRTLGAQLAETCAHLDADRTPAELLELAGLEPAAARLFPHELSGGMAQRAA